MKKEKDSSNDNKKKPQKPKTKTKREREHEIQQNYAKYEQWLKEKGASQDTLWAWDCFYRVAHDDAFKLAICAFPSMEFLAKVMLREMAVVQEKIKEKEKLEREDSALKDIQSDTMVEQ